MLKFKFCQSIRRSICPLGQSLRSAGFERWPRGWCGRGVDLFVDLFQLDAERLGIGDQLVCQFVDGDDIRLRRLGGDIVGDPSIEEIMLRVLISRQVRERVGSDVPSVDLNILSLCIVEFGRTPTTNPASLEGEADHKTFAPTQPFRVPGDLFVDLHGLMDHQPLEPVLRMHLEPGGNTILTQCVS